MSDIPTQGDALGWNIMPRCGGRQKSRSLLVRLLQLGQIFHVGHVREHLGVPAQLLLEFGQFIAELLATSLVAEGAVQRLFVPFGSEGSDNLIQ
jgi:hypothetical protein